MDKELVLRGIVISCQLESTEKKEILDYLQQLINDSDMLNALICVGVDNWGGYGDAIAYLEECEEDN